MEDLIKANFVETNLRMETLIKTLDIILNNLKDINEKLDITPHDLID